MRSKSIHTLLVFTAILAALNIASSPLSDGAEPLGVAIADVVIGVVMLAALVPAWRGSIRAVVVEIVGLVLAGLSALPGVFAGDSGAKVVAGVFTVLALGVAGLLVRAVAARTQRGGRQMSHETLLAADGAAPPTHRHRATFAEPRASSQQS